MTIESKEQSGKDEGCLKRSMHILVLVLKFTFRILGMVHFPVELG